MKRILHNFLRDKDRALKVLVNSAVSIMAVGFVIAAAAIAFMR